ncbi:MAG: aminomethyl-transferring glycine dehydrogenase subunit GcvPA [Gammaproteobacteria bacterium]|nr:aminomethyl-transferring glycine dehydrogenase subunit GcvPA [Gammaproteobacteria bacterium]MCW9004363.1 aminomethyl-transferring glycine dehydrogenase subunit GcvPA [Gammaproteobacteria bacterium]MCW9056165.1 aminomethyl-transferring glycine dehydrogenase subunit GcvPA [Gammaproteobacteria bacterium]
MPFIPHTEDEICDMLSVIGADSIEQLFDEIPQHLRIKSLQGVPQGLNEMEVSRLMQSRAAEDGQPVCFMGAGSYDHHIPAAVWQITTRGEYYTAYTPYQAEASQGTLQLIYEFQSMMTALTAMDVSNASLYDGASALSEAVLMAVRGNRKSKSRRILVPTNVNPVYRSATKSIVHHQNIELVDVEFDTATGQTTLDALKAYEGEDFAAVVISQPTFFGTLEQVDALTDWAHANGAMLIAVVNPTSLSLLKPPGEWGEQGADIACGDGQPLGAPMSSGGPYYGFMCCKKAHVRQMPGRIVGRTVDQDEKEGFVLTLQAREQHIRRSKATSNICTNQGLVVTASTIYMSLLGPQGLEKVAIACHQNTNQLIEKLSAIKGVDVLFKGSVFHEVVLKLNKPVADVLNALAEKNILGGYDLSNDYPQLDNALLVCATEMRTDEEIDRYAQVLSEIL